MKKHALRKTDGRTARFVASEEGVTLLEVLIVIMIMGFIATLGSIQLTKYFSRARVDTAKLQMQELSVALDLFKIDVGRFPEGSEGLQALVRQVTDIPGWRGPYLKRDTILKDPWARPYVYTPERGAGSYRLITLGADGQQGGENDNADISISSD